MTIEGLTFVNSCLVGLGIPYEFYEWTSSVPDTYFVGEYTEVPNPNEDGMEETTFIITGTTNKAFVELENVKQTIKEYFPNEGLTEILESGSGIAIMYDNAFPIPSVEKGVHRLQINLLIKEWRC